MKNKKIYILLVLAIAASLLTATLVLADDGAMFRKNISKTPDQETERAAINHMAFYVPAQNSAGELVTITYEYQDGTTMEREFAKPLVAVYVDAYPEEEIEGQGVYQILSGAGWGKHDAYAAVSLDDGATWKRTNLSESAHLSSFTLANGFPYPGDAFNMTFAIAGDKVLVGWISKYCDGGSPAYTLVDDTDPTNPIKLYPDIWGVAGSQNSVDYTLQGHPEVGEIPYSCVWAARGTLVPVTTNAGAEGYDIVWTKAERLTSGRRDANRLEMAGDAAAGFMMVWQEDPEGLRPGQGLGPGEGWSGAVVHGQTDLWYSYISLEDFIMVRTSDDNAEPISIYEYEEVEKPKVAAPMALPVRLTDNAMCKATNSLPYCYINFEDENWEANLPADLSTIVRSDDSTYCASTGQYDTGGGSTIVVCIAKDGRVMRGRVGASRPRVNVQPYASETVGVYDSAWVILGAEESKALGEGAPDVPGGSPPEEDEPPDIGKNMWYYSFDMLNPDFVMQGGMLNQPAQCNPYDVQEKGCVLGEFMTLDDPLYEDNPFYETEISRRFSHMSQPIHQIGSSGVSSVLIVKQGILNQGGPADIFLRLTRVSDEVWVDCPAYDRCLPAGYNPYAYENMDCDEWVFTDGSNPRYLQGLCLSTPINVSGTNIVACDWNDGYDCTGDFPWEGAAGGDTGDFPKVTKWEQTEENLSHQTWENPYDVAKGHRGFIDGDFIMIMYAWSPNWKANSVGNDKYNLYVRRSFNGGDTWTTTPESLGGDGVVGDAVTNPTACENYGVGSNYETECFTYAAGVFEQARNVSQLIGNKETILDPRYTPTGGLKMLPVTDYLDVGNGELPYPDDAERDRSKYFIVYETGDNTTVAEGEAEPLDLFYSRASVWGDEYELMEYPSGGGSGSGDTSWGFPWLENKGDDMSGEAANTANPGGTFYYVIWNQWQEDEHENISESDAIFRRLMYYYDGGENGDGGVDFSKIPPIVNVYASHAYTSADDTEVIFIGTIYKVYGGKEIVAWKWRSSLDGDLSGEKIMTMRGNQFSIGKHTIYLSAQDSAGLWSKEVSIELQVGSKIYLPLMNRR